MSKDKKYKNVVTSSESSEKKRTTLSLSLSVEDKKALKKYAADHETTVASVIHDWVLLHCQKEL